MLAPSKPTTNVAQKRSWTSLSPYLVLVAAGAGFFAWSRGSAQPAHGSVLSVVGGLGGQLRSQHRFRDSQALAESCKIWSCSCAKVAIAHALDMDARAAFTSLLSAALPMCPNEPRLASMRFEAAVRSGAKGTEPMGIALLAADSQDPYALYGVALGKFRAGSLSDAIVMGGHATRAGRGYPAWSLLGLSFYGQGNFQQAEVAFTEMLKLVPEDVPGLFHLALARHKQGHYLAAREGYLHVARRDPMHVETRYNLGVLAHSVGATDEARHHLAKLQKMPGAAPSVKRLEEFLATTNSPPTLGGALPGVAGTQP